MMNKSLKVNDKLKTNNIFTLINNSYIENNNNYYLLIL